MEGFQYNNLLPVDQLMEIARNQGDTYRNAYPFSHGVYDKVFSNEVLRQVISEFERPKQEWKTYDSELEKKSQLSRDLAMGPVTRALVHQLNSAAFLEFLEQLTGIRHLIPDPYLHGAGLHKIKPGGKLDIHVDFNGHRRMNVFRRLNVLIYLNEDWEREWGGNLELWDADEKSCKKSIEPLFNRMAIFTTSRRSYHGHPAPLGCPEDRNRLSLALYYYTAEESGDQSRKLHSTLFLKNESSRGPVRLIQDVAFTARRYLSRALAK